jgi:molybdate transport system ATP-binding protein
MTDRATRRVDLDTGGILYAAGHGQDADDEDAAAADQTGTDMRVVVAPTAISIHTSRPDAGSPRNTWTGVVAGLELLTDRVRVAVDGSPSALVDITPAAVADLRLAPGQPVWLTAKATEVTACSDPGRAPARAPTGVPTTGGPARRLSR